MARNKIEDLRNHLFEVIEMLKDGDIDIGSTAYDRAMMQQAQRENDLLAAATTQGFGVGQQARQTALQEQAYLRNEPLNTLSAVRTGAQVQGPQFVNSAQQATTVCTGLEVFFGSSCTKSISSAGVASNPAAFINHAN